MENKKRRLNLKDLSPMTCSILARLLDEEIERQKVLERDEKALGYDVSQRPIIIAQLKATLKQLNDLGFFYRIIIK